ncbi:MAG: cell division protein FtsW [Actinomycetota bacterium]
MTLAVPNRSRRTSQLAERRRAALESAQKARGTGRRRRYQEDVGRDPKPLGFYVIVAVTLALVAFGLVMVLSSSSIVSFHRGRSPWYYFVKQVFWAGLGMVALVTTYRMPLKILHSTARVLPPIATVMMLAAFTPGLGKTVNGAQAWLAIGDYTIQPSEFMKLALVVYGADWLTRREKQLADFRAAALPYLGWVGVGAFIAIAQGDLGSCLVITAIGMSMLFLAGAPLRPLFGLSLAGALVFVGYARLDGDKWARFTSFLDIHGTRDTDGYQVYQALISISNGGLTGTGIGAGTGKWGYVPLAHTDFIFSIVGEEMGLLGVLGLLTLFVFLIYFAFQVALSCRHRFGFLLAAGVGCWFIVQISINIGGVIGLLPVTGLTLPFISFGGSSLIASMAAAGLLMNVARRPR